MANLHFGIALSAYYLDGRPLDPRQFVAGLGVAEIPYDVKGEGRRYESARLIIGELGLSDFGDPSVRPEVHDDYANAIEKCLLKFAGWLAGVPAESMRRFREQGMKVWVIVNLWIDCHQMDFTVPPKLSAELGRLNMELYVLSNE